jgi:hypothetical protein
LGVQASPTSTPSTGTIRHEPLSPTTPLFVTSYERASRRVRKRHNPLVRKTPHSPSAIHRQSVTSRTPPTNSTHASHRSTSRTTQNDSRTTNGQVCAYTRRQLALDQLPDVPGNIEACDEPLHYYLPPATRSMR